MHKAVSMLSHVPFWVFGILALLVALGIRQSRPRTISPVAPTVFAGAFILFSVYDVISSFGPSIIQLLAWVFELSLSAVFGQKVFGTAKLTFVPGSTKVLLPGSWLPLGLMLGIFLAKFVVGFVEGAHLAVGTELWFAPLVSVILGALSGAFLARAIAIRRFVAQGGHHA